MHANFGNPKSPDCDSKTLKAEKKTKFLGQNLIYAVVTKKRLDTEC